MGAGASFFKKKNNAVKVPEEVKPDAAAPEKAPDFDGDNEAAQLEREEEAELAAEGIDEILCRLAQANAPGSTKRWGQITKKLNRTMRQKEIPAEPLKALLAQEGSTMPQCWVDENAANVAKQELAVENTLAQKRRGVFGGKSMFGKPRADIDNNTPTAVDQEAGESDTEPESDIDDEENPVVSSPTRIGGGRGVEGNEQGFVYQPLTKYEVFAYMRRLHSRMGPRVLEAEEAVETMNKTLTLVGRLYDDLPAAIVKGVSQDNRISAGLKQESLVYGELEIASFVKVFVKLKRIHGHMMEPGGSFWDLGAGVGKLVIAAAMGHNFESCYGVEVLAALRDASRPVLMRWRKEEVQKLKAVKANIRVDFMCADMMEQEGWAREATILFVHTNLSAISMRELRKKVDGMKVGALCLSVSVPAVEEIKWGLLAVEHVDTSWGSTRLYIHEKLV